jgi:hypothetical protein
MKTTMFTGGLLTMMLTGCLMAPYPPEGSVTMAPALPSVVWLDTTPYYYNHGYTYYYQNRVWHYSNHKGGPWTALPRDRYPKEVRHRDRDSGQHHAREHGKDHNRRR